MKNFNLMYHGSARDVSDALEAGVELEPTERSALLCNIMRRLAVLEEKAATPVPVRKRYKVTATKMVAFGRLHELDESVPGNYFYDAINSEDALDQFHLSIPIKVLEDFEIDVELDQ